MHFSLVCLYILVCFFWPSLLNLPFSNNACADGGLSKIVNIRRKNNFAHDVDINISQIEKKISSFKKNPLQFFMNENVLHNRSENLYNYIRRLFT